MMTTSYEICNAFNGHASLYDEAAKMQCEIGSRLFERLNYLKINPQYILDLGCGTGLFIQRLKKQYPKAKIIGFDLAHAMLEQVKKKQRWRRKSLLVNGDMMRMPFSPNVFDLVFANQVLHWSQSLTSVLSEINRVMNVHGALMFSTLGPDTFQEIKNAWALINSYAHINDFVDMHDVGDALLAECFIDPVVDMEMLTLHYDSFSKLVRSLKAQGIPNINPNRHKGLTGKRAWSLFEQNFSRFKTPDGRLPLTYEVIYGHAWKGEQHRFNDQIETMIAPHQIQRSLKRRE